MRHEIDHPAKRKGLRLQALQFFKGKTYRHFTCDRVEDARRLFVSWLMGPPISRMNQSLNEELGKFANRRLSRMSIRT